MLDGVRDGFLINPVVSDARTDITTEMLSENGYSVMTFQDEEEVEEKNDITDTLSIVAIISIIILCSLGCVFFITGIRKNLR